MLQPPGQVGTPHWAHSSVPVPFLGWETPERLSSLDVISQVALQLVCSPANTAQDEAGLCSKGTLLARVQLIHQTGALCPSVLPGHGIKIHALFTRIAWNSLSSTSPKSNSLLFFLLISSF